MIKKQSHRSLDTWEGRLTLFTTTYIFCLGLVFLWAFLSFLLFFFNLLIVNPEDTLKNTFLLQKSIKFGVGYSIFFFIKQSKAYVITWIISGTLIFLSLYHLVKAITKKFRSYSDKLFYFLLSVWKLQFQNIFTLDFKDINNSMRASLFLYKMHILAD